MSFKDIAFVLLFLAAWIVLNRWILPRFGIPTCMSGSCVVDPPPAASEQGSDRTGRQDPILEALARPDHEQQDDRPQTTGNPR